MKKTNPASLRNPFYTPPLKSFDGGDQRDSTNISILKYNIEILKKIAPNFMIGILFLVGFMIFHPPYWLIIIIITTFVLIMNVVKGERCLKKLLYVAAKVSLVVSIIILFSVVLGMFGIIGFILLILLLAGYRMYQGRKQMITHIRYIETKIWGKSLDKSNWKRGELKSKKIKLKL